MSSLKACCKDTPSWPRLAICANWWWYIIPNTPRQHIRSSCGFIEHGPIYCAAICSYLWSSPGRTLMPILSKCCHGEPVFYGIRNSQSTRKPWTLNTLIVCLMSVVTTLEKSTSLATSCETASAYAMTCAVICLLFLIQLIRNASLSIVHDSCTSWSPQGEWGLT